MTAPAMPFTLHRRKSRSFFLLFGSMAFAAMGVLLIWDGEKGDIWAGWLCAIFFGVAAVVFLIDLHPRASFLTVDERGIEICSLFKKSRLEWPEIAEFRVFKYVRWYRFESRKVGIMFTGEYRGSAKGIAVAAALVGVHGQLPDTYGMRADDLVQLLTSCREEAMRKKAVHASDSR